VLVPFALLSRRLPPRRLTTALIVCALVVLGLPGMARAQADFTVEPSPPAPGQEVTFAATGVDSAAVVTWDFGDGSTPPAVGQTVTHTFEARGTYTVTMTVVGEAPVAKPVHVTHSPVAAFDFAPTAPDPGEDVLFSADDSSDPDGDDLSYSWDFGDGSAAVAGVSPRHAFANAGSYDVVLTVTDEFGAAATATANVTVGALVVTGPSSAVLAGQGVTLSATCVPATPCAVAWDLDGDSQFDDATGATVTTSFAAAGWHVVQARTASAEDDFALRVNAAPVVGFVWSPSAPLAGAPVQLVSTSADAEGALRHAWELDGDGDFNDAATAATAATFTAGTHAVSLRVTDSDGVVRTITRTITVLAPAATAPTSTPPRVLSAVVRLAGTVLPRGTRVSILSVRAPRGATVVARCTGRGCPVRSQRKRSRTGFVRFRDMEALLKPRARLEVLVQATGAVGKYTRFTIRSRRRPKRTERCLPPGGSTPEVCDG